MTNWQYDPQHVNESDELEREIREGVYDVVGFLALRWGVNRRMARARIRWALWKDVDDGAPSWAEHWEHLTYGGDG